MGEVKIGEGQEEAWTAGLATCAGVAMTIISSKHGKIEYKKVVAHIVPDFGKWALDRRTDGEDWVEIGWRKQLDELKKLWHKVDGGHGDEVQAVINMVDLSQWAEGNMGPFPKKDRPMKDVVKEAYDVLIEEVKELVGFAPQIVRHDWARLEWPLNSICASPTNEIWANGELVPTSKETGN
ncbi:Uu.00g041880.m01.CDS01 [Anthostomella pinea]|uniref:Uu.00g041880.m01.CDS01 n=1 Tax=Anthostomella pinea TaxID=933095 RepID=A0AAI8VAG9_9PEZI|nr:Uu.00g041880.m01.CDS01 [Anthostomella pinea]